MTRGRLELIAWRERMGLKQTALAEKLTISGPYLNQIEHGARRPGPSTMLKIMDVTGIPMRAWLETAA